MWVFTESPTVRRGRYIFVSLLFVVFVALAYGGAALKSWLDANLPPIVERLVRTEIERVVGRVVP